MRFLTTYASDLSSTPEINLLTTSLVNLLAFCVTAGDTFLPDPASYDDLFYKLVETGPILTKFGEVYKLNAPSSSTATKSAADLPSTKDQPSNIAAIDTLLSVSSHFHSLLFMPEKNADVKISGDQPAAVRKKNLTPHQVHQIIKQGYDTLSIETHEGLNAWEKWREADWKPELKRAARCAVEDSKKLVV